MLAKTMKKQYLEPKFFVDSDHPKVIAFAKKTTGSNRDPQQVAMSLFYAIRDGWRYDPYQIDLSESAMKASHLLTRNYGYCIEKACLLAASARVLGIPSRLGFANVRNHIGTEKLEKILQTDVLVFHGYTELYLDNCWVKATPAFNRQLCDRLNVAPLEFDGKTDSLFQQYAADGGKFMEYLHDYGTFADVPRDLFITELKRHYPHLFNQQQTDENLPVIISGL